MAKNNTCLPMQTLVQHIAKVLPGLKAEVRNQLADVSKEYASYCESPEASVGLSFEDLNNHIDKS